MVNIAGMACRSLHGIADKGVTFFLQVENNGSSHDDGFAHFVLRRQRIWGPVTFTDVLLDILKVAKIDIYFHRVDGGH
ncbi:hypothetical protein SSYM_2069 [Serratia symbiotica str. Tucson]|uniref:Uncharacterized protein n=1 Tax=Serratia symbiotica str. Tucson TaxID=914128 RepID=E9CNP8_9GAMM|nr:hypothetical protein SSYM_2069 [Serratia symbiotica str. Tucson]